MRERLCKAKNITNGNWCEGYLIKIKWYLDEQEFFAIIPKNACIYPHCEISEYIEIDPETICWDTGIKDIYQNVIWENSIVRLNDEEDEMFKVTWHEDSGRYVIEGYSICTDFDSYYGRDMEVIGNIFDNQELEEE